MSLRRRFELGWVGPGLDELVMKNVHRHRLRSPCVALWALAVLAAGCAVSTPQSDGSGSGGVAGTNGSGAGGSGAGGSGAGGAGTAGSGAGGAGTGGSGAGSAGTGGSGAGGTD